MKSELLPIASALIDCEKTEEIEISGKMAGDDEPVIVQENVNRAANIGQEIDYNHPLFLSPSDVSGNQIISFQLTGMENYAI